MFVVALQRISENLRVLQRTAACTPWTGMNEKARELQKRTQEFARAVIAFCETLPNHQAVRTIVDQLLDSATATDSNYRATCRAKSLDDFISKIATAA